MARKSPEYQQRFAVIYVIMGIMAFLLVGRLFILQVIHGAEYKEITATRLVKTMPQQAPRGEILDRYGRPMVSNRTGYSVKISDNGQTDEELNSIIKTLVEICELEGQDYNDELPLTMEKPFSYTYYGTAEEIKSKTTAFLESVSAEEAKNPDALLKLLYERYEINPKLPDVTKRKIAGIRAGMELKLFSRQNSYRFADDVNMKVVTKVKETDETLEGVNIAVEYFREYNAPGIASHILGRTGAIYYEEYQELKDKGYTINDIVGKEGIEKYCESTLRGKDGTNNIEEDKNGHIISTVSSIEAVPGNDVVLTIDLELQKVTEKALGDAIDNIRAGANELNDYEGADCTSGSAVVLDIHSGEVLSIASYPSYNLGTFNEDYEKNYNNKSNPMWNRAISGTYEPGSTYKMVTAIAGLESGTINTSTTVKCDGRYMYYAPDYMPYCWKHEGHGIQNVENAIKNSCNCFFYETGRLMGIDKLTEYTKKLGFGELTGIEIAGEAKGLVADPKYVEETLGETWWPGDTIQAAIGQSKNLFTPIQLANYMATLANGGKRYKPHLIKNVKEYSSSEILKVTEPYLLDNISISPENYKAVMNGMKSVTEDGTAAAVFADFDVSVGGKTGTAEVSQGSPTGIFVAFAPFENPQIAMAIVIEHGSHGISAAPVARSIIENYFSSNFTEYDDGREELKFFK